MIKNLTNIETVLKHFKQADPKIFEVLQTVDLTEWFTDRESSDHFQNLVRNIIYQQLAGKAASAIYSRFESLIGGDVTPDNILRFSDAQYREIGLSWAKAKYIRDLSTKVKDGTVNLINLDTLDNESIISELIKVKGIGRWTAEMFLLFTLHREDIFSHGDLGLKNGFIKLYELSNPSPEVISDKIAQWSPYASYGSICLWHYLDNR